MTPDCKASHNFALHILWVLLATNHITPYGTHNNSNNNRSRRCSWFKHLLEPEVARSVKNECFHSIRHS